MTSIGAGVRTVDTPSTVSAPGCTLSVVLPNYNHARYLSIALERLVTQTRPADEIIIIDDASTDDSVSVIEQYAARHPILRLVRNSRNLGVVRNVNLGLEMALGTYIFYASADDAIDARLFEKGLRLLEAYPEAALFTATADIIDAGGRRVGPLASAIPLASPGYIPPEQAREILLRDDAWFTGTSTIWKRSRLRDVGGFPEELGAFADGYLARMFALTDGSCFSPEVLGSWRRMESGYAGTATTVENARKLIDAASKRMTEAGTAFPPGYAQRWSRRYLFGASKYRLSCARKNASGLLPWLVASARELILSTWYFLTMRPADTFAVARRRLKWALYSYSKGR